MKTNHTTFSPYKFTVIASALLAAFYSSGGIYAADQELRQKALQDPEFLRLINKLSHSYKNVSKTPLVEAQVADVQSSAEVDKESLVSSSAIESAETKPESSFESSSMTTDSDSRFVLDEELIVTVKVKNFVLGEIFIVKSEQGFKLSFNALMQALQFAITTDQAKGVAQGWFIRETNKFSFRWPVDGVVAPGKVVLNNTELDVPFSDLLLSEDDLYVELTALQQWFNLKLEVNERELELIVSSDVPLPVEEKAARRSKELSSSKNKSAVLPEREGGYTAFSTPIFDAQLNLRKSSNKTSSSASVLGSQDLAFLNAQYYVSARESDVQVGRLTFEKESVKQDLLGPLKLSKISFGDVSPVNTGYSNTYGLSRGLSVTNRQRSVNLLAKTVNLQGEVQEGWDVELYRNRLLLDRKSNISAGRYEFNDIELLFGPNEFEVILYGPQGQIEVRQEYYDISELNAQPGDVLFDASLVELGKTLFNNEQRATEQQGNFFSSRASIGVTEWWGVETGIGIFDASQGLDNQSITLGNSFSLKDLATIGIGYQQDSNDLSSPSIDLRTGLFGVSIAGSYQRINDPASSLGIFDQSERYRAQVSGQLFAGSAVPLRLQNTWDRYTLPSGEQLETFKNNINSSIGRFSVGNQLTWINNTDLAVSLEQLQDYLDGQQQPDDPDAPLVLPPESFYSVNRDLYGAAQIRTSLAGAYVGLGIDYSLKPDYKTNQYSMNIVMPLTENIQSRLGLGYVTAQKEYAGQLSLSYRHDNFMLTLDSSYSNDQWFTGLNARMSFGYEPSTGQYMLSERKLSDKGAVAVKVYEDKNANMKHDAGEPLIKDAKIVAQQSRREAVSNKDGIAIVKALPVQRKTDVVIDLSSLDEPNMIGLVEGYSITPRPGYINVLELPVVLGGEVEGSVSVKNQYGVVDPVAYAQVELHDFSGNTVASTQSEFDGYYLFAGVKPGRYVVRLNPEALKSRKVRSGTPIYLKYRGDGELINGADFVLEAKEASAGYAIVLGEFSSLATLKAYWNIMKKYGSKVALDRPFYAQNQDTSKYELFAGFYQTEQRAEKLCNALAEQKVLCTVRAHNFDL